MIPEHELYDMCLGHGMSQVEIAEKIGVSCSTIRNWMKEYGIETRVVSESNLIESLKPSREKLYDMYCRQGMIQEEIAEKIGVSQPTIRNWMKKYGIETRTISESRLIELRKPSEEELYDMYWWREMTQSEIAEKIDVPRQFIYRWMKKYRIKTRTSSEAQLNGNFIGEKSGNWQGGISGGKYCYKFNNLFKEAVRERDDYTCQLCGNLQEFENRKLSVHHIHYYKADCWPDVVVLCRSCNTKVNANRDYWEEYFENQLIKRGLMYWSLST